MFRFALGQRGRYGLLGAVLALGSSGLGACSGTHEPAQHTLAAKRPPTVQVRPTTNLPALLGQPIEALRQQLAPAAMPSSVLMDSARLADLAPRATDSLLTFRTGGLLLLASYDIKTRQVHDYLVLGQHEDSLMQRAALRLDAPTYLVLPTFYVHQPGKLMGVRVIPIGHQ